MSYIDDMYRAFKEYRKETDKRNLKVERKKIFSSNTDNDLFIVKKYKCMINDDWITEIEKGLVFVDNAIKEERQFIRTNGETVPIEKARRVSRDSVVHLAKHSNLITRVPDDPNETLVPDQIYMVEKLSDYAVYENRFLYLLLYQLDEFISLRLNKIKRIRETFICDFNVQKEISSKTRVLSTNQVFHEEIYNNPYPIIDKENDILYSRIKDCQQIVTSMLKTNLMIEVSKAPLVKPPITKTNVLKMNNNFKNALALYDFICTYKDDGYEAIEVKKEFNPLNDAWADEFCEAIVILEHLTNKYGNEIVDILENNYQEEEAKRIFLEEQKLLDKIKKLKKRVAETGQGLEEYMLALEERNKVLEKYADELLIAQNEIVKLNNKIEELKLEIQNHLNYIDELKKTIEEKDLEIARLNQKYIDDMAALKAEHALEIKNLIEEHNSHIDEIREIHRNEIIEINRQNDELIEQKLIEASENYVREINSLEESINELKEINISERNSFEEKINSLNENIGELEEEILRYKTQMQVLEDDCNNKVNEAIRNSEDTISSMSEETKKKIDLMTEEKDQAIENYKLAKAELNALRIKSGMLEANEDLTSKERFTELEEEFMAYYKFFKAQWNLTKKDIRRKILWMDKQTKK